MSGGAEAGLVIRAVERGDARALARFFDAAAADPAVARFFHPHPLTADYAAWLCEGAASRRDRYYVATFAGEVAGYAMLRGWDEGYEVPSFGCCVHPALRGARIGAALVAHAIEESRRAGAPRLRLTVYRANEGAVRLYARFGFVYSDKNPDELVGLRDLAAPAEEPPPAAIDRLLAWRSADAG